MTSGSKIWDLSGYVGGMSVAQLGTVGKREDRWGWIWLVGDSITRRPSLQVDGFGRLWVRGDATVLRNGTRLDTPTQPLAESAFVQWKYPPHQEHDSRVLALYVPTQAIKAITPLDDEPFGSFVVKEVISRLEDIPQEMRLD